MKKISTWMITLFLGAGLALAQNTGGDKTALNPQPLPPGKKASTTTKTKKTHTSHKGGKKAVKSTPKSTTTPPPK